ncbi:MAG TPA: malto-oligosyltrehalose synthase [Chryseolinea sp.]|nr:malto-oligosyltrehalose synthase [Chryseolinea sp.]
MNIPTSTYRLQFNKDFTFQDLLGIIDYLHALGISTIYASPILKSAAGSLHGYDVIDPHSIDPEIGTKEELQAIALKLKEKDMTWVQDIVPNHMAFNTSNERLMDVLERGPSSTFYQYFDIQWNHPHAELKEKLMVPFLGEDLESCIKNGHLKLTFSKNGFEISYGGSKYPVSLIAYDSLFSIIRSVGAKKLREEWKEFVNGRAADSHFTTWKKLKTKWINVISGQERNTILQIIDRFNSDTQKMLTLLSNQHYVFTHWKRTEKLINYRRFFTVNQLICLRMEDESVFNEYHSFLHSLYKEDLIQGFRIDHIDGLKDPSQYLRNLRRLFGDTCYIIVEKILDRKEAMPADWLLQGTSGYEFLAAVNQLFTNKNGARELLNFYRTLVPTLPPYKQLVEKNKTMMLQNYMEGEWDNLIEYLFELNLQGNFTRPKLKQALGLIMVSLPVYRIYPKQIPVDGDDLVILTELINKNTEVHSSFEKELNHFYTLFVCPDKEIDKSSILDFLKRLMQFTGPLTAKGVEDTTFYIYNPLISHDEVGDSPLTLGMTVNEFHKRMTVRQKSAPYSLNATATHDTKRGEDVRLRLNVLSDIPDRWREIVKLWLASNGQNGGNGQRPEINDEYFIYQSIIGGFPEDLKITDAWINRLKEYLVKVVREAKVNSNWESPNEVYEKVCTDFIENVLKESDILQSDILPFAQSVIDIASDNTLGQLLIKITAPGIPDIYQGCELWDLSWVDPDNRRPVDFEIRKKYLEEIIRQEKGNSEGLLPFLLEHRDLGFEKLFVSWRALNFRKTFEHVFKVGEYVPLQLSKGEATVCAFARRLQDHFVMVVIPIACGKNLRDAKSEWSHESITLGPDLPSSWTNIFTGKEIEATNELTLTDALGSFPVALLTNKKA